MKVLIKTKDAISHFGDISTLASQIEVSVQAIYQWGDFVPDPSVGKIMAIAKCIPFQISRKSQSVI